MDTFKDFFSDLKDRLTNPFVSSFAIGWIAWNYEIVVALLFYKVADYSAFMIIVRENVHWLDSLVGPILIAFFILSRSNGSNPGFLFSMLGFC